MRTLFFVAACLLGGCTLERIEHDSAAVLGAARLSDRAVIERSTRWRLGDPGPLEMDAAYDPNDPDQVRLLQAAYAGIAQIYPQTVLADAPAYLGRQRPPTQPVALLIHVDIPPAHAAAAAFPVALVDLGTGAVIDRATLRVRAHWWGSAEDPVAVARLFSDYASQLRPRQ